MLISTVRFMSQPSFIFLNPFDLRIQVTQLRRLDPFPSKVPWFLTIGRGFVTLRNLLFNIPVEHDVSDM